MANLVHGRTAGAAAIARELGVNSGSVGNMLIRGLSRTDIIQYYANKGKIDQPTADRLLGKSTSISIPAVTAAMAAAAATAKLGGGYVPRHAKMSASQPAARIVTSPPTVGPQLAGSPSAQQYLGPKVKLNMPPVLKETIHEAECRKEQALASLRELELSQKRGEVASVALLNRWFSGCIKKATDYGLRIGMELADRLAAETNPVKVAEMVTFEVRRMLEQLKLYGVEAVLAELDEEEAA